MTDNTPILEPEPAAAARLFDARIDLARAFVADLADRGGLLGLIGPLELPRLWTRHIVNSVLIAPLLGSGPVADVGSGAGLPGLVLAIARPDIAITLIEPMERRCAWLQDEIGRLRLDNATVLRARAEDAPRKAFAQVTARAVGALRSLIPLTVPLLEPGGELILMKGARAADELAAAAKQVQRARLRNPRIEELDAGADAEVTRVFRATVD